MHLHANTHTHKWYARADIFYIFILHSDCLRKQVQFGFWNRNPKREHRFECRFNAVQFITILFVALRWQEQYLSKTSNSQQSPHTWPSPARYGVSIVLGRKLTTSERHRCVLNYINVMLRASFALDHIIRAASACYLFSLNSFLFSWSSLNSHKSIASLSSFICSV